MFADAYRGKRVFVTGHTGFKGAWLCLWLEQLGAQVTGFALDPPTSPSLFAQAGVGAGLRDIRGDVRDAVALAGALAEAQADFVFHLAAQPLVLDSYADPAGTYATNVGGTINLLEALRSAGSAASVVMVTTDKVYRNCETGTPFAEDDPLGGHDPYSSSKAAMEIAVASWRASFFGKDGPRIAAARAGNVIGGGDWSADRIVPDLARALAGNAVPELRHPGALRPWQHVIEPLAGYLQLGVRLAGSGGADHAEAWNLGPDPDQARSVGDLTEALLSAWGRPGWVRSDNRETPHEAGLLRLAIGKACDRLGWAPVWDFAATVKRTAQWYRTVLDDPDAARTACLADIDAYCSAAKSKDLGLAR